MIQLPRFLMGVSLVLVLLSTLSYTLTGRFDAWWSFGSRIDATAAGSPLQPGPQEAGDLSLAASASTELSSASSAEESASGQTETSGAAEPTITPPSSGGSTPPEDDHDHEDHESATTTTPSDDESNSGAPQPPPPETSGVITGDACPCTVTGTAELKGTVSLQGDLMVVGGTLVARPGVTVDGNGHQIMFMKGGRADFQGSEVFTWSGDGSNANLKRDINFRNLRRIMFHEGAGKSTLRYFTVSDSGTASLGDYPIHFHMNGNSTRGTLVEGVVVVNGRHHAFVPHGSHGITFIDTIAKNTACQAYWWDPPKFQSTSTVNNSNDTIYDHALADGVTNCPGDNRGFTLSAFHLGPGRGNTVKNSVARNVSPSNPKDCSGFHWPELHPSQPSSWGFSGNASYRSRCNGIFVWQNDSEEHIIRGFRGDGIDHGAYINRYDYRDVDVSFIDVHALGWSVRGGSAARVTIFKHSLQGNPVIFEGLSIGELVIDNATDGGSIPGTYQINGSGLSCSEIVYRSLVPGTQVIIDGVSC